MNSSPLTRIAGLVVTALLMAAGPAHSVGEERVGTSMGTFLKIGVGAKAAALGEAFTAVADDPTALFWNPAGLTNLNDREVYFSHTEWVADISYEYVAYVQPFPLLAEGTIGIHLGTLGASMMETTEHQPYGTGREFTYSDFFLGVGAAQQFTDKLSLGFGIKFIREDFGSSIGAPSINTWTADFGTFYRLGVQEAVFSVAFLNFGPDWKPSDSFVELNAVGFPREREFDSFSPPTSFKAGVAFMFWENDMVRQNLMFEMNRPPDNAETFRAATEFALADMAYLRTGYNLNADELKWSVGAGFLFRAAGLGERVDYAFTQSEFLGRVDRISAGVRF